MSAGVERLSQRKYQAWCPQCGDGLNTSRQVDAHMWASSHNLERHAEEDAAS